MGSDHNVWIHTPGGNVYDAFRTVNVYCDSRKEPHPDTKWHVARFVRLFRQDMDTISPNTLDSLTHYGSHEPDGGIVWRSVMVPRSRQYRNHGVHGTGSKDWVSRVRNSDEWEQATVDGVTLTDVNDGNPSCRVSKADFLEAYYPQPHTGSRVSEYPPRWAHDPSLPRVGYGGAKHVLGAGGAVYFQMSCPCGYRIRRISESELTPVLEQLTSTPRTRSGADISVQNLLKLLH